MAKTNYAAHDARYQQLRAQGAQGWDSGGSTFERELTWALRELETAEVRRVLELGCGAGNNGAWLAARGFEVTGIDISPTAIAWATERAVVGARFLIGDLTHGIEGEYDLVVDGHCLHCIIGDDRARVLRHVHQALVPGGSFFLSTMCGEVTQPTLKACFDPVTRCQVVDGVAYRFIGAAEELLDELRAAGLVVGASRVELRKSLDDQDHLWAVARKPAKPE